MRQGWMGVIGIGTIGFLLGLVSSRGGAEEPPGRWQPADRRVVDGNPVVLFVESEKTAGRPAFKIETRLEVSPFVAAATLMEGMLSDDDLPKGQRRRILERSEQGALVYTFIDLPFPLSDRELALRIVHSRDDATGIHRVEWAEANDALPAREAGVVRLSGAVGHWELRPDGRRGTHATHMTQTELGGSIPDAIGDRLMKAQALDSVDRLRDRIRDRERRHVAGAPPVVELFPKNRIPKDGIPDERVPEDRVRE